MTGFALVPVLSSESRPLETQPFPDAAEYADAAYQLARGNGYVTYVHNQENRPPRYPPGFSLALTPFVAFAGPYPASVQMAVKVFAALYVLAAVFSAWALGGPLAAALTATLVGVSPLAQVSASLILSDAFAAALTVFMIVLLHRPSARRVSLAGALTGALLVVRLSAVVNLMALILSLPPRYWRRVVGFSLPAIIGLGLYHWRTFGSPFRTGYGYWLPDQRNFHWIPALASPPKPPFTDGPWVVGDAMNGALLHWICPCPEGGPQAAFPNAFFYPLVLLGLFWIFAPPLTTLPGLWGAWTRRREAVGAFTLWLTVLSLSMYAFYFYQGARFMAGPATLLVIFTAASIAGWAEKKWQ